MLLQIVGAILLTYFFSRLTNALPLRGGLLAKVGGSHALSLLGIGLILVLLRGSLGAFEPRQLVIFPAPQFFWMCFDLVNQYQAKGRTLSN